jgi:hypothetical protein
MKIFEGFSKSKKIVFNVKKLLKVAVDLTLWGSGKKSNPCGMSGRFC